MDDELKKKMMAIYAKMENACAEEDYEISFSAWRDFDSDSADNAANELFDLVGELL